MGLFLLPDDYIGLISNFHDKITKQLVVEEGPNYPIGYLDDIKINFLHYSSVSDAYEKFTRRRDRMLDSNFDNSHVVVKFCDIDGATKEQILKFHIEAKKIGRPVTFSKEYFGIEDNYQIKNRHIINNSAPDGLRLFKLRYSYFDFSNFVKMS